MSSCCSLLITLHFFYTLLENMQKHRQNQLRNAAIIIFVAVCIVNTSAQEPVGQQEYNTIFFRANNSYREKKYDDAIQDYEKLISAGLRSANIFYNLGNAYLRTSTRGKAILYYERAIRMCPRDADIRSNLDFARSLVEGDAGQNVGRWYEKALFPLRGFLSTNEISFFVCALYFGVMIFLALGVYFRAQRKLFYYFAAVICVILIIVLPSFINSVYESGFQEKAVIMVKRTSARFEPNDDATVHFELYEGTVIQITRSREDWCQIKRQDGKMGWLKSDVLEAIRP